MNDLKNQRFPTGSYFILWNIFFDRFSSGGFIVILAIYLHQKLDFDTNTATALYHVNEFCLYFFSIVGAIIADCYWGIYRTLTTMSILIAISGTIVSIASMDLSFLNIRVMSFIGLICTMIGTGCVKTSQNAFGGNQFKMPEQSALLDYYFSIHYLFMKFGHVTGMVLVPILREDLKCFGDDTCYPVAFGAPTMAISIAFLILFLGRNKFVHVVPAGGNALINVVKCIKYAMQKKLLNISPDAKHGHWLDFSEEKFGPELVQDTKILLNVLTMYLPLPIYWALLNQQASRWVFQATRMNGDIGWYTIKPDQMIVVGPLLIMIMIPLFNQIIFPILAKFGIKSTLQKMGCGMVCAALSFAMSAYVETKINEDYISILWLFPQYLIVAVSEVLLWVANVAFAYTQAPSNMKSVMTSSVYMSVAGGSLIVFAISGLRLFDSLVNEFIFYSFLMVIDTVLFVFLAKRYRYHDVHNPTIHIDEEDPQKY
ncbi:peptide transporter family 1-like [Chironomus tepperi]|uniref:peptide transporter family 1-like n=1 Tax=Chironomus tepperi TaxID=113505 RepID=UPI00391F6AB3